MGREEVNNCVGGGEVARLCSRRISVGLEFGLGGSTGVPQLIVFSNGRRGWDGGRFIYYYHTGSV